MNPDVEWSTREKLAIASYVYHTDDQHWTGTISRLLRPLGEPGRPPDWFSAKNCAQQYTALVEAAETTRRKRSERSDSSDSLSSISLQTQPPSISETIVQKLTQERIEELHKHMRSEREKYRKILQTIEQIESGDLDDKLDEMIEDIERNKSKTTADKEESTQKDQLPVAAGIVEEKNVSDKLVEIPNDTTEEEVNSGTGNVQKNEEKSISIAETQPKSPSTSDNTRILELREKNEADRLPQLEESMTESVTASPVVPNSQSETVIEKEETISPVSSSRTLPTPTPIIESDSCEEEDEVSKEQPLCVGEDEQKPDVVMDADSQAMDVISSSTPDEFVTMCDADNADTIENSSPPSDSIPTLSQASEDANPHDETREPEEEMLVETDVPSELQVSASINDSIPSEPVIAREDTALETSSEIIEPSDSLASAETTTFSETTTQSLIDISAESSPIEASIPSTASEYDVKSIQPQHAISITDDVVTRDTQKSCTTDEDKVEEESFDDHISTTTATAYSTDSFPNSPALSTTSDVDPEATAQSRAWKKSIMILWKRVASHRYASVFLQPVTNDIAPNYSGIVYRPMDLATLKKNVENGLVRTTSEFQRDLMLMFQNALMYNNHEHDVYKMTQEMRRDVMQQVLEFRGTQLMMEASKQSTPKGLRRSTLRKSIMSEKVNEGRSKRN